MRDDILFKVLTDQYLFNSFITTVGIKECLNAVQVKVHDRAVGFSDRNQRCLSHQEAETLFDKPFDVEKISTEFTFDSVLNAVRSEKMKRWIINVAEDIEKENVDYDKVYRELSTLKERLEIHIPKGIVAGDLIKDMVDIETGKVKTDTMRTGIKALDYVLHGGLHKGELVFLIAPPGRGKSTFLLNLLYSFLIQERVTLMLSNELRAEAILSRLYRRILKMPRNEFHTENREAIESGLGTYFKYAQGKGIIHYVPVNSWGLSDVKAWVTAWEKQLGRPVDAIIIDYIDRLKKPWGDDNRLKTKALVDELRDYAVEKDIFVGSATQANRNSLNAPLVTEEHVAESFGKVESADVVMSISQSPQERDNRRGRITVLKNREYGGAGTIIDVKTDWDTLMIGDMDG